MQVLLNLKRLNFCKCQNGPVEIHYEINSGLVSLDGKDNECLPYLSKTMLQFG